MDMICAGLTTPGYATPMIVGGQRGDGQITVAEFLEGAIRLRGLAKSVDLAQVGKCLDGDQDPGSRWDVSFVEGFKRFWKVWGCEKQNHKQAENEWNMTHEEREVSH